MQIFTEVDQARTEPDLELSDTVKTVMPVPMNSLVSLITKRESFVLLKPVSDVRSHAVVGDIIHSRM